MDKFVWATIILAIWAAVGPLVGIYVGHHLLRSQQRRQWLADNRIQEWREVITTLHKSLVLITQFDAVRDLSTIEEKVAAMPAVLDARALALSVLSNRIFIAKEVRLTRCSTSVKRLWRNLTGTMTRKSLGRCSAS